MRRQRTNNNATNANANTNTILQDFFFTTGDHQNNDENNNNNNKNNNNQLLLTNNNITSASQSPIPASVTECCSSVSTDGSSYFTYSTVSSSSSSSSSAPLPPSQSPRAKDSNPFHDLIEFANSNSTNTAAADDDDDDDDKTKTSLAKRSNLSQRNSNNNNIETNLHQDTPPPLSTSSDSSSSSSESITSIHQKYPPDSVVGKALDLWNKASTTISSSSCLTKPIIPTTTTSKNKKNKNPFFKRDYHHDYDYDNDDNSESDDEEKDEPHRYYSLMKNKFLDHETYILVQAIRLVVSFQKRNNNNNTNNNNNIVLHDHHSSLRSAFLTLVRFAVKDLRMLPTLLPCFVMMKDGDNSNNYKNEEDDSHQNSNNDNNSTYKSATFVSDFCFNVLLGKVQDVWSRSSSTAQKSTTRIPSRNFMSDARRRMKIHKNNNSSQNLGCHSSLIAKFVSSYNEEAPTAIVQCLLTILAHSASSSSHLQNINNNDETRTFVIKLLLDRCLEKLEHLVMNNNHKSSRSAFSRPETKVKSLIASHFEQLFNAERMCVSTIVRFLSLLIKEFVLGEMKNENNIIRKWIFENCPCLEIYFREQEKLEEKKRKEMQEQMRLAAQRKQQSQQMNPNRNRFIVSSTSSSMNTQQRTQRQQHPHQSQQGKSVSFDFSQKSNNLNKSDGNNSKSNDQNNHHQYFDEYLTQQHSQQQTAAVRNSNNNNNVSNVKNNNCGVNQQEKQHAFRSRNPLAMRRFKLICANVEPKVAEELSRCWSALAKSLVLENTLVS